MSHFQPSCRPLCTKDVRIGSPDDVFGRGLDCRTARRLLNGIFSNMEICCAENLFRVGGPSAVRSSVFLVPKHLNPLQCVKYLIVPFPIDWHVLFQVLLVHVPQCCTYWPTISAFWFPYTFWFPTHFELVEPKVSTVKWWMQHYKAPTAKRHYGYANSPVVRRLDRGTLQRTKHGSDQQKIQTCEKYYDGSGKLRYKGTRHLKGTEPLASNSTCFPVKTDGVPGNSHSS